MIAQSGVVSGRKLPLAAVQLPPPQVSAFGDQWSLVRNGFVHRIDEYFYPLAGLGAPTAIALTQALAPSGLFDPRDTPNPSQ